MTETFEDFERMYKKPSNMQQELLQCALCNLLTDIRHFAKKKGLDFHATILLSEQEYQENMSEALEEDENDL